MSADVAGLENAWNTDETDSQINAALAIRACLENLRQEAAEFGLADLVRFIDLASMAAGQAADELGADGDCAALRYLNTLGRC